jgi:5'-nucleotidase
MRKENRNSEGECYQVNSAVRAEYDEAEGQLISLTINGNTVEDNGHYTICLQGYHFSNSATYLNVTNEKLLEAGQHKVITTSAQEVLEEYLRNNQNISRSVEGRLVYR